MLIGVINAIPLHLINSFVLVRKAAGDILLNDKWEAYLKESGADFVRFVDISSLPENASGGYSYAVLFGKALSKGYLKMLIDGRKPERNEFGETEDAMDELADAFAQKLTSDGFKSVSGLEYGVLPHKTIARMAGLGFIGKNTLLVSDDYGCALVLGKVLTSAPFVARQISPSKNDCGECSLCADACQPKALSGTPWRLAENWRNEMLDENKCTVCMKCMIACPHTVRYAFSE